MAYCTCYGYFWLSLAHFIISRVVWSTLLAAILVAIYRSLHGWDRAECLTLVVHGTSPIRLLELDAVSVRGWSRARAAYCNIHLVRVLAMF